MSEKNIEEDMQKAINLSDSDSEQEQDKPSVSKNNNANNNANNNEDNNNAATYDFYNEKQQLSEKQFKLFLNIRAREFIDLENSEIIRYILSNQNMSYNQLLKIIATDKKKKQAIIKLENKQQKKIEKMQDKEKKIILSKEEKVLKKSQKMQKEQKNDYDDDEDEESDDDYEREQNEQQHVQPQNGKGTSLLKVKNSGNNDADDEERVENNVKQDAYVDNESEDIQNTREMIKFLQQKNKNLEKLLNSANDKYYEKKEKIKSKAEYKANKYVEDELKRIADEKEQSKEVKNIVQKELTKEELSKYFGMKVI